MVMFFKKMQQVLSRGGARRTLPCFLVFPLILPAAHAASGDAVSMPCGIIFENNFYRKWGIKISYADSRIFQKHLQGNFSYTTSRLEAITGNALKKDNFLFGASWNFLPSKMATPCVRIDLGWTHFDREDDVIFALLKNTSMILALDIGARGYLWKRLVQPWFDMGYSFISSSTVYPAIISAGIDFDVSKGLFK